MNRLTAGRSLLECGREINGMLSIEMPAGTLWAFMAQQWGGYPGWGSGYGSGLGLGLGLGLFGWLFHLALWLAVLFGLAVFIRWAILSRREEPHREKDALDILRHRYVRGEINRTEFEEKRRGLEG
jgi:putative membrane protein